MRIAMSCHPTQGGSGILASELAMVLASRGHQVHLAACSRPFRLYEDSGVVFHKIDIPDYPLFSCPPHDLALANKLAGLVTEYDVEIIHAHYAIPHSVMALLAREVVAPGKVKVISTLHGTDITLVGSHREFFALTRYTMEHSDGLTAVSRWLSEETVKRFDLAEAPEVIHNFFNAARFNPEGRVGYPGPGEEFHLVHASNLRPVKRISEVVRVFHAVQKKVPARLTIVGDGPEKGLAEELVSELEICDRVRFVGASRNMPEVMRGAHLFVLLSEYESFGLSALEAMACGTPVAATSRGGLPEIIENGVSSMLFPAGEVSSTAEGIVEALSDRERWKVMSDAAARRTREHFEATAVVSKYEAMYERVVKRG